MAETLVHENYHVHQYTDHWWSKPYWFFENTFGEKIKDPKGRKTASGKVWVFQGAEITAYAYSDEMRERLKGFLSKNPKLWKGKIRAK